MKDWAGWRVAAAVCALVVAVVIAGCSGGSGQGSPRTESQAVRSGPVTTREAMVPSFDGTPLATTFFPAAGLKPGEQAPTVLHAHRWGYVRERDAEDASEDEYGYVGVGPLRRAGFNVLTWDARGYGESGGIVQLQAPDAEGRDVSALLDYVAQQAEAQLDGPGDPRVGMVGTSYGGGLQLVAAAQDARIEAIVPDIGWHSLTDSLYKNGAVKLGWATFLFSYGLRNTGARYDPHIHSAYTSAVASGKLSDEDFAWFASRGPGDRVTRIRAATLITQSTVDTLFPLSEGIANYEALAGSGGVSIGSLYQYFPNKGALLARLWERHAQQILSGFQAMLESTASLPLRERIEACLDWLIDTKREGVALERALYLHLYRYGDPLAVARLDAPILRALMQGIDATVGGARTDLAAFVLLQAVRGVVLSGVFFHPESIADGSLRRELSALVRGYLAARGGPVTG